MSYTPLLTILVLLVVGGAATLALLFYAYRKGYFDNLKSGAYVIFDEEEPVGEPQDQWFRGGADEPSGSSSSRA
jgi:hypothetical protein